MAGSIVHLWSGHGKWQHYSNSGRDCLRRWFELGEAQVGGARMELYGCHGHYGLDGLGVDGDGAHAAHEHIRRVRYRAAELCLQA